MHWAVMTVLMGLQARLRLARLYLCTDARTDRGDLADFCEAVFAGGVDILQIRQKDMDAGRGARGAAGGAPGGGAAPGDRLRQRLAALAGRFSADMLHLGQTDGPSRRARRHLHRWALIGRSTHAPEQTDEAIADDQADYFCVGPVYATSTKPDYEPVGLDLVRYAAEVAPPATIWPPSRGSRSAASTWATSTRCWPRVLGGSAWCGPSRWPMTRRRPPGS